ncbi:MAG: (d)CMP kinase [Clostridia bacterium]|nr:(d)CMP kinase [Clostridia bacterium]
MIIAIDGTSSSGKSSIARALGKKLNISVIGTGSIYRAIALKMLNFGIDENDDSRINTMLDSTIINIGFSAGKISVIVDGILQKPNDLNSPNVSKFTPKMACKEIVREFVRKIQKQEALNHKDIIIEGRDIGSVVFPNAEVKIFIDADQTIRAKRRLADYIAQGKNKTLEEVLSELEERDNEDRNRELSPLIMTSDSVIIDTTSYTIDECVEKIIKIINSKK